MHSYLKCWHQIQAHLTELFKKFNFRIVWADGQKGPASLCTKNYASGPDAALDSWVILKKATTVGE